jgi:hypothetical protein
MHDEYLKIAGLMSDATTMFARFRQDQYRSVGDALSILGQRKKDMTQDQNVNATKNGDAISLQLDSLVSQSVLPDVEEGKTMKDGCGQKYPECLAWFDRDTSCWKTCQGCLFAEWESSWVILPSSGTMRNGRVFQHAPWVSHTCGEDCSLWPTPMAAWGKRGFGFGNASRRAQYKLSVIERLKSLGWNPPLEIVEELMGFPQGWCIISES